jgi:hypothetical protein
MIVDKIITGCRSIFSLRHFVTIPSFGSVSVIWIATILSTVALTVGVMIVIVHFVYKSGFYAKNYFQTKHDIARFFHRLDDGRIMSSDKPEWTKYCDVSRTLITNGDSITDDTVSRINQLLERSGLSSFSKSIVSAREVSYVACRMSDDSSNSSIEQVICATPATLQVKDINPKKWSQKLEKDQKQNFVRTPIYVLECFPDDRKLYSSREFQTCLATLMFFQQSNTPQANVSLLRTNGLLWNLVPLTVFDESTYKIDKELDYKFNPGKKLRFFVAKADNIRNIIGFVDKHRSQFDIVITKELSDLLGLIDSKNLVIVGCVLKGVTVGALFFVKRPSSLELCGSLFGDGIVVNVRLACFSRSLILANRSFSSSSLTIPMVSHNKCVVDMIGLRPLRTTKRACYLRNYRAPGTYDPTKCLILV